jgi:hypothetical protein
MRFSYNLSTEIPDFLSEIATTTTTSKYFTVTEYSTKSNDKYKIVRYNKDILINDLIPSYGLLRCVILNKNNQVSCFAPPKSCLADQFITKYATKTNYIIAQEFVEGTMINVFYDETVLSWKIATRNTVDAEVYFYKKENGKTFNAMFFEACKQNNFNLEMLNKQFCYSFVLQHPDNRIVVPFQSPQLYLVEAYEIINSDTITVVPQNINEIRTSGDFINTTIRFPEVYEFTTYTELIEKFASANTPYNIMGIVIKNVLTNERTKIRNPIYEEVRHLKGNQTKTQYQYLHLRKEGKLPEYLKYYPESKKEFSECREKVHVFTNTLHQNYLACYVRKEKPLKEFGSQFRTHMFNLHQQFINDLRPNNLFITNTIVQKYVNNLHPSLLMHSLNYNLRKQNVDTIKADASNNV